MLTEFFYMLRDGGLKPSITELLTLLEAMRNGIAGQSVDDFYYLARSCLGRLTNLPARCEAHPVRLGHLLRVALT